MTTLSSPIPPWPRPLFLADLQYVVPLPELLFLLFVHHLCPSRVDEGGQLPEHVQGAFQGQAQVLPASHRGLWAAQDPGHEGGGAGQGGGVAPDKLWPVVLVPGREEEDVRELLLGEELPDGIRDPRAIRGVLEAFHFALEENGPG